MIKLILETGTKEYSVLPTTTAESPFTPREIDVLKLVVKGFQNREIATKLGIGRTTVISYVQRLMRKTETSNRIKLTLWALANLILWSPKKKEKR